jgi:hypothetical protein
MALEDYLDSEVGIAVAATAVLLSPKVRGLVRKGIVSVLAGAIKAGDVVARGTRNMQEEAKHVTRFGAAPEETAGDAVDETSTTSPTRTPSRARQQMTEQ